MLYRIWGNIAVSFCRCEVCNSGILSGCCLGKWPLNECSTSTTTSTICGDACPLSCASAEAYKLAQCTRTQGWEVN